MSAVREAIAAALLEAARLNLPPEVLIDRLVQAVERVPVVVTIRDLDMEPENILTFDGQVLRDIAEVAMGAYYDGQAMHVAVDGGSLKLKVGELSWSPPIYPEASVYGE